MTASRYPRPWRVDREEFGLQVVAADGTPVCLLGSDAEDETDLEVAYLLAGAPETTQALRDYQRLHREGCRCDDERRHVCVACRADAALARVDRRAS